MLESRAKSGQSTRILDEQPELWADAEPFWEAFQELTDQRDMGMGAGAIRREAVTDFLDEHGITDPNERQTYRDHLRRMDHEYLGLMAARTKKKTKDAGNPSKRTLQGGR